MLKKYKMMSVMAKSSFWALVAGIFQKGIGVIFTPVFTRILTTEEYAQYTLYQSWHDIFIIFVSLNVFNYATYNAMVEFEEDREGFISSAQTLVTGLTLICFGIYYVINCIKGDVIGFPLPVVFLMLIDMMLISAFNLWSTKERYYYRYKLLTIVSIIIGLLGPILGIIAINYSSDKGYGRIYGVAIVNILFGLFFYIFNIIKSRNLFCWKYYKFILLYCIPLIPHFLSSQVLIKFDRIMIDDMCGASDAGIYGLAYSISMLMTLVSDAVLKALTPWTYQCIKNDEKEKIKKIATFMIILVALANIVLILFAPEAVRLFAPEEYYSAIYVIPPISTSVYFSFLFNVFANIEYYYAETKYVAIASFGAMVMNIALNYIFIPIYGFVAAGYTTMVSYIVYAIGHYVFMRVTSKKYSDNYLFYDGKSILLISIAFVAMSLLIEILYETYIVRYIMILLIFIFLILFRKRIFDILFMNRGN